MASLQDVLHGSRRSNLRRVLIVVGIVVVGVGIGTLAASSICVEPGSTRRKACTDTESARDVTRTNTTDSFIANSASTFDQEPGRSPSQ